MVRIQKGYHDFYAYIDFINYVFGMNGTHRSFDTLLPKLYADGKTSADDTYFAIDGEKLVGAVLSYPLTFNFGATSLPARGIGSVSTHPRHRGEGHMKALMNRAIEDMQKDGVALSVLGGRRGRYAHWGFEKCDAMSYYTVSRDTLRYHTIKTDGYTMKKVEKTDAELLDSLRTHMNQRAIHVTREKSDLYDVITSWKCVPFAYFKNDALVGYSIYYGGKKQLSEFEVFDLADVPALLFLSVKTLGEISIAVPLYEADKGDAIDPYAEEVSAVSEECFLVLDFDKVLSAFSPSRQAERRSLTARSPSGSTATK